VIGDLHLKAKRGYADYTPDGRVKEVEKVLKQLTEASSDCDKVVLLGDSLNSKNNDSSVIKQFVSFLESFEGKEIVIIGGNHDCGADGKSALDFLKEIRGKNWTIITDTILERDGLVYCPYFYKQQLGVDDLSEARDILSNRLPKGKILFIHHAFTGTNSNGMDAEFFPEIVLPLDVAKTKYDTVFAGHIHQPQENENLKVVGSVFCDEMGEKGKNYWKVDTETLNAQSYPIDGVKIVTLENPKIEDIKKITDKENIFKIVFTEVVSTEAKEEIEKEMSSFYGWVISEQYTNERVQLKEADAKSMVDMSVPELLKLYSDTNNVPFEKIIKGWELIQNKL